MQKVVPGEVVRLSVSGGLWALPGDEAFFGPARFDLRLSKGKREAITLTPSACGRGCLFGGAAAGAVAVVTARQVTTRGRLLTHAWALEVANAASEVGATA